MKSSKRQKFPRMAIGVLACWLGAILAFTAFATPTWAISYSSRSLPNSDFSGQDLTDDLFDHANLRDSNLSGVNAQGVRFFAANLERTNFEGANLTNADLESTRLTRANLTNAILVGAFLTNIKIEGVIIDGADFTDAILRPDTEKLLCQIAKGTNPVTGRNTHDTLYCP